MQKIKVLFLCTGNSCRSQMAEGWARALKSKELDAHSAGIETHGLNPLAVKVMSEAGVDISNHRSKPVDELKSQKFDYVVTVCDHARETCPAFPAGCKIVHVGFEDPPALAGEIAERGGSREEQLQVYRRVRDEIRSFIERLPGWLKEK